MRNWNTISGDHALRADGMERVSVISEALPVKLTKLISKHPSLSPETINGIKKVCNVFCITGTCFVTSVL